MGTCRNRLAATQPVRQSTAHEKGPASRLDPASRRRRPALLGGSHLGRIVPAPVGRAGRRPEAVRVRAGLVHRWVEAAPATPDALAVMAQMERLVGRLEEQMAGLAAENRSLREEIAALRPAPVVVTEATVPRPPRPQDGGRNRGLPRPPHASSGTGWSGSSASKSGVKAR